MQFFPNIFDVKTQQRKPTTINYKSYRKLISIAQRSRTKMFENNTTDVKKT